MNAFDVAAGQAQAGQGCGCGGKGGAGCRKMPYVRSVGLSVVDQTTSIDSDTLSANPFLSAKPILVRRVICRQTRAQTAPGYAKLTLKLGGIPIIDGADVEAFGQGRGPTARRARCSFLLPRGVAPYIKFELSAAEPAAGNNISFILTLEGEEYCGDPSAVPSLLPYVTTVALPSIAAALPANGSFNPQVQLLVQQIITNLAVDQDVGTANTLTVLHDNEPVVDAADIAAFATTFPEEVAAQFQQVFEAGTNAQLSVGGDAQSAANVLLVTFAGWQRKHGAC